MRSTPGSRWVSSAGLAARTAVSLVLLAVAGAAAPARAEDDRVTELERKVDALTQEIEDLKLGGVADTARAVPKFGLGLGASKVYGSKGVSIGGYGEMLYTNFDRKREDKTVSGATDRLDFLRHVLYLGYKFHDALLLNSEIEFEHAGVTDEAAVTVDPGTNDGEAELSGEAVVEFAYLDWLLRPAFGVRAGMLLVPLGLTNEMHEPTAFLGARRPDVEQVLIPSTWSANGIGVHGTLARDFTYRAYLVEGLNAEHLSAEGIRGARQGGSQSVFERPALTGRLDYQGLPGLLVGAAAFSGDSWQALQRPDEGLSGRVTLWDTHLRYERQGFEARGLYARGSIDGAEALAVALGLGTPLGNSFYGYYAEAGYDVLQALRPGSSFRLVPYVRLEKYDTQEDVPAGGAEDPSLEHQIVTAGAAFQPHPNVTLKLDRSQRTSPAETEISQWNAAIGYVF